MRKSKLNVGPCPFSSFTLVTLTVLASRRQSLFYIKSVYSPLLVQNDSLVHINDYISIKTYTFCFYRFCPYPLQDYNFSPSRCRRVTFLVLFHKNSGKKYFKISKAYSSCRKLIFTAYFSKSAYFLILGLNEPNIKPVNVLKSVKRETSWAHQKYHFSCSIFISKSSNKLAYHNKQKTA